MPPRYAYWTILVDEQPTAFRSAMQEDLLPTLKRLKHKHPSTRMVWFQNGKIWASRLDAQEAMRARGEMGRRGDTRQAGGFRDRQAGRAAGNRAGGPDRETRDPSGKLEWRPRGEGKQPRREGPSPDKLEWRPKGAGSPRRPRLDAKPAGRRDKTWRPGGEHKDPRQKYKDAKKAKWTRFKQTVRKRWESKQGRKKKDE